MTSKKIITYNVNGIRAAFGKGFIDWLQSENPDVLCIQEIKAEESQIETESISKLGYHNFWFSAQKKGYSGVGILSKQKPDHVEYGMGIEKYDYEGRMLRADFGDVSVVCVYHPSGSSGEDRQAFKIQWLGDFSQYIENLKNTRKQLIICGDFNICRLWIDIHNPQQQLQTSGFLPEEREWFQTFIDMGFCDSFRKFNPEEKDRYSWWSYRAGARMKNKGWRIDYCLVSNEIDNLLSDAFILPDAKHSDHCPVGILINT
jgi:exodeoxyribonuclease-3